MKTILVADDSAVSRELVREALEEIGYHVIEAADGGEALAKAIECAPDMADMRRSAPCARIRAWRRCRCSL
jgi:CheY-like chemotaxis protein